MPLQCSFELPAQSRSLLHTTYVILRSHIPPPLVAAAPLSPSKPYCLPWRYAFPAISHATSAKSHAEIRILRRIAIPRTPFPIERTDKFATRYGGEDRETRDRKAHHSAHTAPESCHSPFPRQRRIPWVQSTATTPPVLGCDVRHSITKQRHCQLIAAMCSEPGSDPGSLGPHLTKAPQRVFRVRRVALAACQPVLPVPGPWHRSAETPGRPVVRLFRPSAV